MKKNLLILMTLFTVVIGYSQTTFTDANFIEYEVINNFTPYTVQVKSYDLINGGTAVNIPTTVIYNSITYAVTGIGESAFDNKAITNVYIPSGVTFIGNYAFRSTLLTEVTMPDTVMQIGLLSFIDNSQLTNVTLSSNLSLIPTAAFQGCAITNVTIPNSVTNIGANAFRNNQLTSITIPANVVIVNSGAFYGNPLTSVTSVKTTAPSVTYDPTNDSFSSNRSGINLIIPIGSTTSYNVYGWFGFASVTESTLSASGFEVDNDIKVITTPEAIKIVASNSVRFQNYTIYNISGAKVAIGSQSEIATSSFASGIYILKLDFDKGTVSKKVAIN
tara:strand:- start:6974 stop:7969 length:996 start_codon:yes stop_codon:yes gene_type:complete